MVEVSKPKGFHRLFQSIWYSFELESVDTKRNCLKLVNKSRSSRTTFEWMVNRETIYGVRAYSVFCDVSICAYSSVNTTFSMFGLEQRKKNSRRWCRGSVPTYSTQSPPSIPRTYWLRQKAQKRGMRWQPHRVFFLFSSVSFLFFVVVSCFVYWKSGPIWFVCVRVLVGTQWMPSIYLENFYGYVCGSLLSLSSSSHEK